MDIGKEKPAIVVEPIEDPFAPERDAPTPTPTPTPEPDPVEEPAPA